MEAYRLDVDIRQVGNELGECREAVVHALQEHSLIANYNAMFKELVRSLSRNPRDFISVVDVGVETDLFPHASALF